MAAYKFHYPARTGKLSCAQLVCNIANNLVLEVEAEEEEPEAPAEPNMVEAWWRAAGAVAWDLDAQLTPAMVEEALARSGQAKAVKKAFNRLSFELGFTFSNDFTPNELLLLIAMGRAWVEAAEGSEEVRRDLKNLMRGAPSIEDALSRRVQFAED
jgi:hypothetical protein